MWSRQVLAVSDLGGRPRRYHGYGGVIKRTVMKSSDVDTQEASKAPKVNENPDVRKVLGRPFQGPPGREEIQNLQMKAEFNKAHLTCARCGAAPSLEPRETLGLIRTEGSTLSKVRAPGTGGPAGTPRGRYDARIHQKDTKR